MRKSVMAMVLGFSVLISSCKDIYIVPSLRPLYTDADTIFDPTLLGSWTSQKDSKGSLTFTKGENKSYKCVFQDGEIESTYVIYLTRINGRLFLDMFPLVESGEKDTLYSSLLLPVHTFFVVRQINPTLIIDLLNSQWLVKTIEDNTNIIQHEIIKEKFILLTAPPEALQVFLLSNIDEAFEKSTDAGLIKKMDTQ